MKKILRIPLLLVALLLTSIPLSAHDFEVDGFYYNITSSTDKTVEVSYCGSYSHSYSNEYTGSVVIPEAVTYSGTTYSVTSIGHDAFRDCVSLTSVAIPNSVTSIGDDAFWACSGLTEVTIPNSVTTIGNMAFRDCASLTSVAIPNSVTSIGHGTFFSCTDLTSVTIPNSVTTIGDHAFFRCTGLTSITIPNSVTWIGAFVFYDCTHLGSVTIGDSVTTIGDEAFSGCTGLTSVTIPNSVTSIGEDAFNNCTGLTTVNFNATNCTTMGSSSYPVFEGCSNLKTVTIGDNVQNIPNYAFKGCTGLTSITIPNSVTEIGDYAFYNCSFLTINTNCSIPPILNPHSFSSYSATVYVPLGSRATYLETMYWKNFASIIGETLTNDGLTYLSISSTEVMVKKGVNDHTVVIPETITIDGNTYIVTEIADSAFVDCQYLTSITIPNSVSSIGDYAFNGCSGLKSLRIEDGITELTLGCNLYDAYYYGGKGLFYDCQIEELYIGRNLNYTNNGGTGNSPFYNSNIKSLTIGSNVNSIKSSFFENAPIKTIWFTNNPPSGYTYAKGVVNYVPNEYYTSLPNVTVYPYLSSLFEIDGVKFVPVSPSQRTCDAIDCVYDSITTDINIGKTVPFKGVEMTLKDIKPYTFYNNNYINTMQLSVGNIGDYTFFDCTSLNKVTIGDGVEKIGNLAFSGCINLDYFSFGVGMKSIGDEAFYNCIAMTKLVSKAAIPPTCGTHALDGINKWNCELSVPNYALSSYQNADQWKDFFFINGIEFIELTKVWQNTTNVPGAPTNGYLRYAAVSNGHFLVNDKARNMIIELTEAGYNDYYNPSAAISEYYGGTLGTAISCDDAGNILVNSGFTSNSSGINFTIISADLSETFPLDLTYINEYCEYSGGRVDQIGHIRGDMLSEEGAYLIITPHQSTRALVVKIVEGQVDYDYSFLTTETNFALNGVQNYFNSDAIAQPAYKTQAEFDYIIDEYGEITQPFLYRTRSAPTVIYAWREDGSAMYGAYNFTANTVEGHSASGATVPGFDWFKLGNKSYYILPLSLNGTSSGRGSAWAIYDSDGEIVAYNVENAKCSAVYYGSFYVVPNDENSVYIYHFLPGIVAEKYLFKVDATTRIEDVVTVVDPNATEVARYDIHGRRLAAPAQGINIVIYSDGTTRKEVVR